MELPGHSPTNVFFTYANPLEKKKKFPSSLAVLRYPQNRRVCFWTSEFSTSSPSGFLPVIPQRIWDDPSPVCFCSSNLLAGNSAPKQNRDGQGVHYTGTFVLPRIVGALKHRLQHFQDLCLKKSNGDKTEPYKTCHPRQPNHLLRRYVFFFFFFYGVFGSFSAGGTGCLGSLQ